MLPRPAQIAGWKTGQDTMEQDDLIDTEELRAFDAVATKGSFSRAALALGVAQSTVSQRISRLEKRVGRQLIRRTTRRVELTPDGESMLIYARSILAVAEDARHRLRTPPVDGVLKVGIEDEFATTKLPRVLGIFRAQYPNFELRFTTGRNEFLDQALRSGDVDIVLGKCHPDQRSGEFVWRERLVWFGHPEALKRSDGLIPLVTYLGPSITGEIVEAGLRAAHRPWIVVAQGSNLLGLIAAAEAGIGVMALGRSFRTPDLAELPQDAGLPALGALDYVLKRGPGPTDASTGAFMEILKEFANRLAVEPEEVAPPR